MKKHLIICVLMLLFVFVTGCAHNEKKRMETELEDALYIRNLSLQDADAAIIKCEGCFGLIDTGHDTDFEAIKLALEQEKIDKLSFLVLTHFDKDHIGSAASILESYSVDQIFVPDYIGKGDLYRALAVYLDEGNGLCKIDSALTVNFGGLTMEIFPSADPSEIMSQKGEYDNDMSLVLRMVYGDNTFLFAGDIEKKRIKEMLADEQDYSCDWLKYPHHGRYKKIHSDFLDAVSPDYVVISSEGTDDKYKKTIEELEKRKLEYFSTAWGDVVTISDGKSISISVNR